MKPKNRHCIIVGLFLFSHIAMLSGALTQEIGEQQDTRADSAYTYPAKMSSHSTWEKIVSFPGTVANIPFRLVFGGLGSAVRYAQEAPSLAAVRELLVPKIRIHGVLPTASGRSGVGLKYYVNHFLGTGSRLTFNVKHGLIDRRQKHYVELRDIPFGGNLFATTKVEYRVFHNESFFGIGRDSDFDDRLVYDLEQGTGEIRLAYKPNKQLILHAFSIYGNFEVQAGDHDNHPSLTRISNGSLSGLGTRSHLLTTGIGLSYDSRDSRALTHTGWEAGAGLGLTRQLEGSAFEYWNLVVDIKRYFHLFYGRRLSLRVAAERVRPLSGHQVPFYNLSELGRRETIRGYSRGRFRDLDMVMWSAEYRYPVWQYFDWMLFLDGGQVSRDILDGFEFGNFEISYGGGFLIRSHNDPILQLAIGVSKDLVRFYLVLN